MTHQQKRLPCIPSNGCPRQNAVKPRKRRRDIPLPTRKRQSCCSLLVTRQPGPVDEAPDNSRKIPIGKSEIVEKFLRDWLEVAERLLRTPGNEYDPGPNPPPSTLDPSMECLDGRP